MTDPQDTEHSDPTWDYYHRYVDALEQDPDTDLEGFLDRIPAELRGPVKARIEDFRLARELLGREDEPEATGIDGYELGPCIGSGGAGRVHRARRLADDRVVALKVLRHGPLYESRSRLQFEREVAAIEGLDHPAIASIVDKDPSGRGRWLATSFVEGRSLADELRDQRRVQAGEEPARPVGEWLLPPRSGRDFIRELVSRLRSIAQALVHAHEHGVLHRDVKPGNILLRPEGGAVLVDFGLSKLVDQESRSNVGDLMGTIHYMSPEQVLAKRVPIGQATDIWSFGVVLYEALAGRRPFDGEETREVHRQICFEDPAPLRGLDPRIPRSLARLVGLCLEKNPRDRLGSARELLRCLDAFLAYEDLRLPRPPLHRRVVRTLHRHRLAASAFAVTALLLVVFLVTTSWAEARGRDRLSDALTGELRDDLEFLSPERMPRLELSRLASIRTRALDAAKDPAVAADAELVLARLRDEGERSRREGLDLLAAGVVPVAGDPKDPKRPDLAAVEQGQALMRRAGQLLHGSESWFAKEVADICDCRVRIQLEDAPPEAGPLRFHVFRMDPWTGNLGVQVAEGKDLAEDLRLQPGLYRIYVFLTRYGVGDYTRWLQNPGERCRIHARIRKRSEVVDGMVHFPRQHYFIGAKRGSSMLDLGRKVELWGFWIDRNEVSIRQYLEFMGATGHPAPAGWPEDWERYRDRLEGEWAERPVSLVTQAQARAYAEWAGKRLPTALEWEAAFGGPDGRRYPWPDGEAPSGEALADDLALGIHEQADPMDPPFVVAVKTLYPIGKARLDRTPEGLYGMVGNVQEWTETPVLATRLGSDAADVDRPTGIVVNWGDRIVKGLHAGWDLRRSEISENIRRQESWSRELAGNRPTLGFRCARSAWVK